jgi:hypothetical protein
LRADALQAVEAVPQPTGISAIAHYTEIAVERFDPGMSGVFRSIGQLNEPIWVTRMKERYVPTGHSRH